MRSGKKEINNYISNCLDRGLSFATIEQSLIKSGYKQTVAEGIILKYKHKGGIIKWLTISVMLLMFMGSVFLMEEGIVGMVSLGYTRSYSDNINLVINQSSFYSWYTPDQGEVVSLALSGNVFGSGNAKIYIENEGKKFLILDSSLDNFKFTDVSSSVLKEKIRHFENICEESCMLENFNKSLYNMIFEVSDATLEIERLDYDIKESDDIEGIPSFNTIPSQKIGAGSVLRIDLNSYFNSSSRVEFSFLRENPNLNIVINDNMAVIRPTEVGTKHVYFIAESNGVKFMSNLVKVEVVDSVDVEVKDIIVKEEPKGILESQETSGLTKILGYALIGVALLIILILALIPSRYYDITKLASKIDSMRKTRDVSKSIDDYKKIKAQLKNKKISLEEQEKLVDDMDKKIKGISSKLPKLQIQEEFKKKCIKFEKITDRVKAKKAYVLLRKLYLKVLEAKIPEKEKTKLYNKMEKYYESLK